ncbi:MAG TPA: tetratricopeptide repeat protein [Steroidobacteraceae bacterium]|jgi:tetratricopeptide (TPR) repeat protein
MCRTTSVFVVVALGAIAGAAYANGGGSMGGSSSLSLDLPREQQSPADVARDAYNSGVREIGYADKLDVEAAQATDPKKQTKTLDKSRTSYQKALKQFENAVAAQNDMYQAWNYIGYAKRKLGDHAAALEAYDRALSINPQYPAAIEYRGVALLGLNRVSDAKDAYLALFASDRKLAEQLMGEIRTWIAARRAAPNGVDSAVLDELAKWVDERGRIASQTAGLSPEGASWR